MLADRIRRAIAACQITTPSGSTSLRCSVGMVLRDGDATTVDDLIGRADAALYEAKRLGRDRAAWAADEHPLTTLGQLGTGVLHIFR